MNLRIGSRGSQLALWQANHISALLRAKGYTIAIEIIKTTGDRLQEVTFAQVGSKGMFTKEIEEALAEGRVDLAVHSLKDLPTELPAPFTLGATPQAVLAAMLMTDKAAKIFAGTLAFGGPNFLSQEVISRISGRRDEHHRQRALGL